MLKKDGQVGEYVLVERLGTGGFGDVWKAEKRTVLSTSTFAVKFFQAKDDEEIDIQTVKKEIMIWQSLSGLPNIISVIEANTFEDYVYIVSEYAEGGSLDKWMRANGGKANSYQEAIAIVAQILQGLEGMHGAGFVHRDLKPANVLIKKNILYLADFGISRQMKTHSKTMGTAGTYEYMPPEAFEGIPLVSVHTDIWATGVLLQKLVTGKLPFPQKEIPALMGAIIMRDPEPLPGDVPYGLSEVIKKALRKKREDRFQSVREMREMLKDSLQIRPEFLEPERDSIVTITDKNLVKDTLPATPVPDWEEVLKQKEAENLELQKQIQEARDLARLAEENRKKKQENERKDSINGGEKRLEPDNYNNLPETQMFPPPINTAADGRYKFKSDPEPPKDKIKPKDNSYTGLWALLSFLMLIGLIAVIAQMMSEKRNNYQATSTPTPVYNANSRVNSTTNSGNTIANKPANSSSNAGNSNSSMTATDYFNTALKICSEKDYDCQIKNYSKALELQPNDSAAYGNRGIAYDNNGMYDLAIKDYNKAIEITPSKADYYTNRGVSYYHKGNYDQAIADYQKALQIDPNAKYAKTNLEGAINKRNQTTAANKPANK